MFENCFGDYNKPKQALKKRGREGEVSLEKGMSFLYTLSFMTCALAVLDSGVTHDDQIYFVLGRVPVYSLSDKKLSTPT